MTAKRWSALEYGQVLFLLFSNIMIPLGAPDGWAGGMDCMVLDMAGANVSWTGI